MSRKTIQNLAIMSALAVGAFGAAACGDDDKETPKSDAGSDAGNTEEDSGTSPPPAGSMMCGDQLCTRVALQGNINLDACCLEDDDGNPVCGIASTNLQGANKPECVPKDAPGVESASCGEIWDLIDGEAEAIIAGDGGVSSDPDGFYTSYVEIASLGAVSLQFKGCCTPAGTCSFNWKDPNIVLNGNNVPTNLGYGCADPVATGLNEGSQILGFGETIDCNPNTGEVTEQPVAPGDGGTDADSGAGDDAGTTGDGGV